MTKHTPPPWTINYTKLDETICRYHIAGPVHGSVLPICEKILEAGDSAENVYADAHLIAAAPDLLEACKAAENHYAIMCEVLCPGNPPPGGLPVLEKLRAALAKAEGKDHD